MPAAARAQLIAALRKRRSRLVAFDGTSRRKSFKQRTLAWYGGCSFEGGAPEELPCRTISGTIDCSRAVSSRSSPRSRCWPAWPSRSADAATDSPSSPTPSGGGGGGTSTTSTATSAPIMGTSPRSPAAQITAAGALSLNIMGNATHPHTVEPQREPGAADRREAAGRGHLDDQRRPRSHRDVQLKRTDPPGARRRLACSGRVLTGLHHLFPARPDHPLVGLLALGADLVHQLGVELDELCQLHRERLRVDLGIVDGEIDLERAVVRPP